MYEIEKLNFINPSQITRVKAEQSAIITKDKDAGTMTVEVFMADGSSTTFSKPKKDAVAIVNHLFQMVNVANNPFLSLPAQQPAAPAEPIKRIPSDGKGVGQHKVDPSVYPPEELDKYGYPIKGSKAWPIGHPQNPDTIAKVAEDARIDAEVQKRLAAQKEATAPPVPENVKQVQAIGKKMGANVGYEGASSVPLPGLRVLPPPAEHRTGEMNVPDHLKEVLVDPAPEEENPFG